MGAVHFAEGELVTHFCDELVPLGLESVAPDALLHVKIEEYEIIRRLNHL